jgi:uncharacterized protein (DUF1501 family)
MKRRSFLQSMAAAGAAAPLLLQGYKVQAFAPHPLFQLAASVDCTDRVLVLIQLNGGNDGLNTVIPLDQYSLYKSARSNIAIDENTVLRLNNATGLHPQMAALKSIYDEGKIALLQGVGYPVPNYSHFRSTDIWLTGSDTEEYLNTGWMGRYLDYQFPGYPGLYPSPAMPDPLAIQIGTVLSTGFEGPSANMAMAFTDPTTFYNIVNEKDDSGTGSRAAEELAYIRKIGQQLQKFANPVKTAAGKAKNKSTLYPAARQNPLADQLKIVAQLIAGGLRTRVYMVNLSGFDTHSNQLSGGNGTPVPHGTLLNQLSVAIQAFMDDCKLLGIQDKILGMTFSEFGRRIKSNASGGTDHGAAGPVFLFGNHVKSGILGTNPIIPQNAGPEDNIPMQIDFRSLYASLLNQWFCVPQKDLKQLTVHDFRFDLPILQGVSTSTDYESDIAANTDIRIFPNPVETSARIQLMLIKPAAMVHLYDNTGRYLMQLAGSLSAGQHTLQFERHGLPGGSYYIQVFGQAGNTLTGIMMLQ